MTRAWTLEVSRDFCLSRLSASASAKGFSENSGKTAETKAMWVPSGDHTGVVASVETLVRTRASPPATGRV